jgi:hypothetical protein
VQDDSMATYNENVSKEDVVIWLAQNNENHQNAQSKLHAIVFDNCDECIDYVININDRKIVLIVSHLNAECVVSVVNEFEQIKAIYVLLCDGESDTTWSNNYGKVRIVSYKSV